MKRKQKSKKKSDIHLRRKLVIIYYRLILGVKIFAIFFIGILFFSHYFEYFRENLKQAIYDYTGNYGLKLEHVLIEGQKYLSNDEIFSCINADTGSPILSLDLNNIKHQLEKNNWVKAVLIERRLPNTLYIGIIEREPLAIWQKDQILSLIDCDGIVITSRNLEKYYNLPHVVGSEANVYAFKLLSDLSRFPDLQNKITSAVMFGARRWNLNLQQNITVKMPANNFNEAWNYLNNLFINKKLFDQNLKIIDLRNNTKYFFEKY